MAALLTVEDSRFSSIIPNLTKGNNDLKSQPLKALPFFTEQQRDHPKQNCQISKSL